MKKLIYQLMAVAITAGIFTACEDVPEPYNNPYNGVVPGTKITVDPAGTGTSADPFNVAAALAKCNEVGETGTTEDVYAKGFVAEITEVSAQYGNATFKIGDSKDGGDLLTVYRAKGFNGENITDEKIIKMGDEVVICGKLVNFKGNTPEFTQGCYIVSVNGTGGGEPGPTNPTGIEVTCAKAVELTNALADNASSTEDYSVTGYITEVVGSVSKNQQTFWMADTKDGGKVFEAYYANLPEGTTEFKVGTKVKITGKLLKYVKDGNVTPEIKNANVEILEEGDNPNPPTPGPTGDNILSNGDFESWDNGQPVNWKSTTSASSATLSQSTDAHGGASSVKLAAGDNQNKRLAYKEITLKAGTYTFSYYAKGTIADKTQTKGGYVKVENGATSGSYIYASEYTDITSATWTLVSYQFTLSEQTTLNLVVMNAKTTTNYATSQDLLVDDASLTTSDGGIADGGNDDPAPTPTTGNEYAKVTTIADGTYIIAATLSDGSFAVATPIDATKTFNYLQKGNGTESNGKLTTESTNEFIIKATTGGYTIQDAATSRYYYNDSGRKNYNVSAEKTDACVWNITFDAAGHAVIKSVSTNGIMNYDTQYNSYGCYSDTKDTYVLPFLFKK